MLQICFVLLFLLQIQAGYGLECYCFGDGCPPHHHNQSCTAPRGSKCYAAIKEVPHLESGTVEVVHSFGCLPPEESSILQCKGNLVPHEFRTTILCCGDRDLCNEDLEPVFRTFPTSTPLVIVSSGIQLNGMGIAAVIIAAVLFVIAVSLCITIYCYRSRKPGVSDLLLRLENQALMTPLKLTKSSDLPKDYPEQSMTSGSGSGIPLLVQITIAKQIQFVKNVGKGRYGEVWQARYRDEDVAVKIFSTLDEQSWQSERDLYETHLLRHENILGYINADITGTGSCTQMLLITAYHQASLYDFLRAMKSPLSDLVMVKMAHSIANGLSFLHTQINGTSAKPGIVHRDIKSKNILVKNDSMSCVIADFGLAMREDVAQDIQCDMERRQGTRRYMAPEVLDFSIQRNSFEALKNSDIYSFGLVLWELARCSSDTDQWEGYELPYFDQVTQDPSFDEMKNVVCTKGLRPNIPQRWTTREPTQSIVKIMTESWAAKPDARLTALNMKKKLSKLQENLMFPERLA